MPDFILSRTRIRNGRYEGVLKRNGRISRDPVIEMFFLGRPAGKLALEEAGDGWSASADLPKEILNEGVQTLLIQDATTGDTLDSLAVVTGQPLEEDLRAEVHLLRAELEMLKSSFRKYASPKRN